MERQMKSKKHPNSKVAASRGKAWKAKLMSGKMEVHMNPTKLRLTRLEKQINQITLAKKIGLSTATYGSIERGKRPVSNERANKIAKNVGVRVEQIFSSINKKKMLANTINTK